ncbi:MAG: response regulator [Ferruginibacter sp.]
MKTNKTGPSTAWKGIQHILLADDDSDDCYFFKQALAELSVKATFTNVFDGEQLMHFLRDAHQLPDVLFLDLNMPRKDGLSCLVEIKASERYKKLPVAALSTSFNRTVADKLQEIGALCFFQKPNEFEELKILIDRALRLVEKKLTGAHETSGDTKPVK